MDIVVNGLSKRFTQSPARRPALDHVQLHVASGEMVALIGASGSGKSTLLRQLSGLLVADAGEVRIGNRIVQRASRLARGVRTVRADVGFIFQQYNLIGRLSVLTNVLAGLMHHRPWWRTCSMHFSRADRLAALEALQRVGLAAQAPQRASTLSGGQQQRVAIARTLVQRARVVLADEPIASLDPRSARRVMDTLARINGEDNVTCLISLHQVEYAIAFCPRTIALSAGRVVFDGPSSELTNARLAGIYDAHGEPAAAEREPISAPPLLNPAAVA